MFKIETLLFINEHGAALACALVAVLKKMTTPFKPDACGLAVHTVSGHLMIEHGGGIEGFNTELAYTPTTS